MSLELINSRRREHYRLNRDVILRRNREWAAANPGKAAAVKRAWATANPSKRKEAKSSWNKRNPEKAREWFRRRHARIKGAIGSHTAEEAQALLVAQNHRCNNPFCQADLRIAKAHLDHIRPLTPMDGGEPGSNDIANLQWLCWPCNASKGNLDWLAWLAGYAKITRDRITVAGQS